MTDTGLGGRGGRRRKGSGWGGGRIFIITIIHYYNYYKKGKRYEDFKDFCKEQLQRTIHPNGVKNEAGESIVYPDVPGCMRQRAEKLKIFASAAR